MSARIVGILFLTAMVASLLGGGIVESIISAPDYLSSVSENQTQLVIGVLLELFNGIAVVGIGVLMFPIIKHFNENIALGYLGLRFIEAVLGSFIVISPFSLITKGYMFKQMLRKLPICRPQVFCLSQNPQAW